MIPLPIMTFGFRNILNIALLSLFIPWGGAGASEIRSFADSLFQQEDYYRAITEYKRFLHFYPHDAKKNEIELSIGFSYLKGEKWDAALPIFQKLATENIDLSESAHFLLAQTYFLSGKYDAALQEWDHFLNQYPKTKFHSETLYQKGWSHFLKEELEEAKKEISNIQPPPFKERSSSFMEAMKKWEERPTRSPFLAGCLSTLLPGTGQWYTGHFWDGASAFVINGIFIYGIYYTFHKKQFVAGGILTLIGSGFYGGNIFSAISGAHKFNKRIKTSLEKELRTRYEMNVEWNGTSLTMRF